MAESALIRYSRWALAVTVAAMPTYAVRFKAIFIPTTLLEVLVLGTIGLYLVGRWQTRTFSVVRTGLEVPTGLLLLAGLLGIAVSPDHVGALGIYRAYFVEPVLLFYVALDLLRTERDFRTVLAGFAAGSAVFALLNLGAWVVALATHATIETGNAPEALYTSPNAVAMFLEPPVAVAGGFALYSSRRRDRFVALGCLALLLPALILTLSRAGLLTLAVLAVVAVVTMPQRRLRVALLGGALVSGVAIARIPFVWVRLRRQLDPNYPFNTFEGRLQIWHDTLNMLRDHPIAGAGLRAYSIVMRPYVSTNRIPELYPHDVFLAMWSELGILGLVAFVLLLATLLWRGWRAYVSAEGFARPLLWGASTAFIAIAVHGLFDTPYFKNDLAVEFWTVAALEVAAITAFVRSATGNPGVQR